MNLQHLSTLCTVLNEGSMTAAANQLYLTQPAISQQIRSLEEELGVTLLIRGARQVKPTTQGQLLFEYAKRILRLSQQAEIAIHTITKKVFNDLRVGTLNSIGMYLISPILSFFLRYNANLSIKLIYGSLERIIKEVDQGSIDIAILPNLDEETKVDISPLSRFKERLLFRDEVCLVSSNRNLSGKNIRFKDFFEKPIVIYSEIYPSFKKIFEEKVSDVKVKVSPVFEANNVGTVKRVIEFGLGWGFLPAHSISKQIRTRRLFRTHCDEIKHTIDLKLYYNSKSVKNKEEIIDVFHKVILQRGLEK